MEKKLNLSEAHELITEAARRVDWHNLGGVMFMIGELSQCWGKHTNDRWVPDYEKAWQDREWLVKHIEDVLEAMKVIKENRLIAKKNIDE